MEEKMFLLVSSYCYNSILQNEKEKEICVSRKHFDHGFFSIEDLM